MTDQEREIGTRIWNRMKEMVPEPYKLKMGMDQTPIKTYTHVLDGLITKDGANYAIMKIELNSLYCYASNKKEYPHFSKQAKDAGYAFAVILREDGDKEEWIIRDLRKNLHESQFVPVVSMDELMYILFDEPTDVPSQIDWKMSIRKLMNRRVGSYTGYGHHCLDELQNARVLFDAATKRCYVGEKDERAFFGELLRPYNEDYICRYTTYETLERILREKKQSVCSVVCMNDETECYYADEYLEKHGGTKVEDVQETNYEELNKCQISSCTHGLLADKLSLWRMYGDDGKGVCLKFKINKDLLKEKGFYLYDMSYAFPDEDKHEDLDVVSELSQMRVGVYTFEFKAWHIWKHFFKPIHYIDEREIRLLYIKQDADQFKWIRTSNSNILAPVIEFGIEKGKNEFPLVLSEIILGPKFPEAATNAAQIKYFKALQQIEEDGDCPVTISKIKGYR